MKILRIDFETRSVAELRGKNSVGLWNYWNHPTTEILMMAYKMPGQETVQLWQPRLGPMPDDLREAIEDPNVWISAFNCPFERYGLQFKLSTKISPRRFIDPQIGARVLAMPPDLAGLCDVLNVPDEMTKFERGEELIQLFSLPKTRKKKGQPPETYFNDWNSHPAEWEEFCEYCKRDVIAEEEVYRRVELLQALPQTPFERKLWEFDQEVNDRGMPVDLFFCQKAYSLATRAKQEALDSQNKLTGLENANSTSQLLPWVRQRGYPYNTLNKNFVDAALKDSMVVMDDLCRTVLQARRTAGSNSYTKLAAIMRQLCPDRRLRNQFIFLGSSRCGRWAGNAVQLHNFPRPSKPKDVNGYDFEEREVVAEARQMIYAEDYDGIKEKYGNVLEVIKSCLRTVFVAPESEAA